jgi:hypothetical protein
MSSKVVRIIFRSPDVNLNAYVEGLGLGEERLSLGRLSAHRNEALDAERLAGLGHSRGPLGDVLVGLLAGGVSLLGDDLPALVFEKVFFLEATDLEMGSNRT